MKYVENLKNSRTMNHYKIVCESKLSWEDKIKKSSDLILHKVNQVINKNIKKSCEGYTIWSEFSNSYKSLENIWENKLFYYYGDLEKFMEDDWRFKKVDGKRRLATFNNLVCMIEQHGLKQNHIRDYLKYLENKFAK